MGFLDNTTITVDAILTKVGRRKLSAGTFNITRYALSDEAVDYTLYEPLLELVENLEKLVQILKLS